ncbi:flavoprotein [Streptomyces sp. NBC_01190]|uniref:flavoprotein n=1 Tax=Streptomyces sp. NBC_01190 TaxID=2903767 RepID=UPI003866D9B1|nr:hypothetical protein OG519_29620 [Streptomyces sp. NBC_01190]
MPAAQEANTAGTVRARPDASRRLPPIDLDRGRVLLVASGAIGVTALPDWAMLLRVQYGWSVRICLTYSADRLVSREALAAVTQAPVAGPGWQTAQGIVPHQELAEWPDLVIVAPATTNFVAKAAAGMSDSLALTTVLCTAAPVLIAPSIPENALARPAVRRNLQCLADDGYHVVPMGPGVSVHRGAVSAAAMPGLPVILRVAARVLGTGRGAAGGNVSANDRTPEKIRAVTPDPTPDQDRTARQDRTPDRSRVGQDLAADPVEAAGHG